MNICFFIGKICSNIQFDFIINSKNTSIVRFNIELSNGSIINVKAYNEIADYCYRKLKLNDEIFIQGYLDNKMELNLVYIKQRIKNFIK